MPLVRPLRGLGYALDRFGGTEIPARVRRPGETAAHPGRVADLTDLVSPPYDVISDSQRTSLLSRHPRNAVRLELSAEAAPHRAAAEALAAWRDDGTLALRSKAALYSYRYTGPDEGEVRGIVARIRLEPWGPMIRPHEHTMPGPKADRLGLLGTARTQLSPILILYSDASDRYEDLIERPVYDEWRARDGDGLLHRAGVIADDQGLAAYLSRRRLVIADGHHRYETALAYQAEVRSKPIPAAAEPGALAADWVMAVLVNAAREAMEIRPTHRLLRTVDTERLRAVLRGPDPLFRAVPVAPEALAGRLADLRDAGEPVYGLLLDGEGWLLIGDADAAADRMRREPGSAPARRLDLALLHTALLGDRLGISTADVAAGETLLYTRSEADARGRVARGEAAAAILVRPTRLEELTAVAAAGDVMPQKSTYFYPKLLTGLVFYPLEG
ncbi:MAG: DUF1015 domain-containing protein [Chloroflexi bacterium]|nr:MAG: DUF1015 domain-containing protein [Chloroflexota bacterium]